MNKEYCNKNINWWKDLEKQGRINVCKSCCEDNKDCKKKEMIRRKDRY